MKQLKFHGSDLKRLAIPGMCAVFLLLMTAMVLQQVPAMSDLAANKSQFLLFMCFTAAMVMTLGAWSILADINILGLICGVCILIGIGSAYQFLFEDYGKYCKMILLALAAAMAAYLVWRRMNILSDFWFYLVAGAVVALLAVNVLFGSYENGAKLSIKLGSFHFQPGEVVKVLLILLGASSFRNHGRSLIYCGLCLVSCGVMLVWINDLGCAVVIFAMFLLMTYLLFDNRPLSIGIICVALAAFLIAVHVVPHARVRMENWLHVMTSESDKVYQQRRYIKAVLYGGFTGLGMENAYHMTNVFAAEHDGALAGVMAVYGAPMAAVAAGAYSLIASQPLYNRSVSPAAYLLQAQVSMFVFCQVILNLCGSLDLLPYSGLVAPLISEGGSSAICFGGLMGLMAASMNPNVPCLKEE